MFVQVDKQHIWWNHAFGKNQYINVVGNSNIYDTLYYWLLTEIPKQESSHSLSVIT